MPAPVETRVGTLANFLLGEESFGFLSPVAVRDAEDVAGLLVHRLLDDDGADGSVLVRGADLLEQLVGSDGSHVVLDILEQEVRETAGPPIDPAGELRDVTVKFAAEGGYGVSFIINGLPRMRYAVGSEPERLHVDESVGEDGT